MILMPNLRSYLDCLAVRQYLEDSYLRLASEAFVAVAFAEER